MTLLDKGFWGADLLLSLHNSGAEKHWLIPARQGVVASVVEEYGPGDRLLAMTVSPQARKKNPALPAQWTVWAVTYVCGDKEKTVFTSLPAAQFSAQQIAGLYHERWEIERKRPIKHTFPFWPPIISLILFQQRNDDGQINTRAMASTD